MSNIRQSLRLLYVSRRVLLLIDVRSKLTVRWRQVIVTCIDVLDYVGEQIRSLMTA